MNQTLPFGFVRLSVAAELPAMIAQLGGNPERFFAEHGLDRRLFGNPDTLIRYADIARILVAAAEYTRCEAFGILLGASAPLEAAGPLAAAVRGSATVGEALRRAHLAIRA